MEIYPQTMLYTLVSTGPDNAEPRAKDKAK